MSFHEDESKMFYPVVIYSSFFVRDGDIRLQPYHLTNNTDLMQQALKAAMTEFKQCSIKSRLIRQREKIEK